MFPLEFWPNDGIEIETMVKHAVYTDNSLVFGNGNGRYCYQCGEERFVFIFSIDNNKVNVIKKIYTVYPDYKTEDGQNYRMKSRRPETLSCAVNSNYIYILLREFDKEGNKRDEWKPDLYGNIVEVYDWDGNKQKEIRLDHYGQRIMLSEDNKMHLFENVEALASGDPGGKTCYNTITTKDGCMVLYCQKALAVAQVVQMSSISNTRLPLK